MRVLAAGHDAMSCDLLPSERPGPHYVGDARSVIDAVRPDLLIAHPPCTFLANSGVRWLYGGKGTTPDPDRWYEMEEAATFFAEMLLAPVPMIAVENPIMHGHARDYIEGIEELPSRRKAWSADDIRQTIQPWQFGHGETKATQLWLHGLPPLAPTDIVDGREPRVHHASPGPERWKQRSRTLPGIAAAMAAQWGSLPVEAAA